MRGAGELDEVQEGENSTVGSTDDGDCGRAVDGNGLCKLGRLEDDIEV